MADDRDDWGESASALNGADRAFDMEDRGESATAVVGEKAELFGQARPNPTREFDTRDVWEPGTALAAGAQAFDILAWGLAAPGTQMADDVENVLWGYVNVFDAQVRRVDRQIDRLEPEVRELDRAYTGTEIDDLELQLALSRLRNLRDVQDAFVALRNQAEGAYREVTGEVWRPRRGSHARSDASAASIDSRDFLRGREADRAVGGPSGAKLVAVIGDMAETDTESVQAALDSVREKHPDMVLAHGGGRGVDAIASRWADDRGVTQVRFAPDFARHGKRQAPFRRNEAMANAGLVGALVFRGPPAGRDGIYKNAVEALGNAGVPVKRIGWAAEKTPPPAETVANGGAAPDARQVWDPEQGLTAVAEAFDTLAQGLGEQGTQMADQVEQVLWGYANVFDAQVGRVERDIARLPPKARELDLAGAGARIEDPELRRAAHRSQNLSALKGAYERLRERAEQCYGAATGEVWKPRSRSRAGPAVTAASLEAGEFLRQRERSGVAGDKPVGKLVAVVGSMDETDHGMVWNALDKVRAKYPDMVLAHGGARGVDKIAARWAGNRGVAQVEFAPDFGKHGKRQAPFRRNEAMAGAGLAGAVVFKGPPAGRDGLYRNAIDALRHGGVAIMRVAPARDSAIAAAPTPAETGERLRAAVDRARALAADWTAVSSDLPGERAMFHERLPAAKQEADSLRAEIRDTIGRGVRWDALGPEGRARETVDAVLAAMDPIDRACTDRRTAVERVDTLARRLEGLTAESPLLLDRAKEDERSVWSLDGYAAWRERATAALEPVRNPPRWLEQAEEAAGHRPGHLRGLSEALDANLERHNDHERTVRTVELIPRLDRMLEQGAAFDEAAQSRETAAHRVDGHAKWFEAATGALEIARGAPDTAPAILREAGFPADSLALRVESLADAVDRHTPHYRAGYVEKLAGDIQRVLERADAFTRAAFERETPPDTLPGHAEWRKEAVVLAKKAADAPIWAAEALKVLGQSANAQAAGARGLEERLEGHRALAIEMAPISTENIERTFAREWSKRNDAVAQGCPVSVEAHDRRIARLVGEAGYNGRILKLRDEPAYREYKASLQAAAAGAQSRSQAETVHRGRRTAHAV